MWSWFLVLMIKFFRHVQSLHLKGSVTTLYNTQTVLYSFIFLLENKARNPKEQKIGNNGSMKKL